MITASTLLLGPNGLTVHVKCWSRVNIKKCSVLTAVISQKCRGGGRRGTCAWGVGDGEDIRSQWGKDAPEELRVVLVSWRKA